MGQAGKAALLLKLRAGAGLDDLRADWRDRLASQPDGRRSFLLTRVQRNILNDPNWADADGPFDALIGLSSFDDGPAELAQHLLEAIPKIDAFVDPARSGLLAGREHAIVAGDGQIARLFLVRKRSELSDAQFHDYWLNVHGRMAIGMADPPAYRQWHADEEITRAIGSAAGLSTLDLNGAAQTFFQSEDEIRRRFANAADFKSSAVYADILKFIDVDRSSVAFFDVVAGA